MTVDTRVVSVGALRGGLFSSKIELCGSNQNSSADRLGLNPAGLTKWGKHQKSILSCSLMRISSKEMQRIEQCSYRLDCLMKTLCQVLGEFRSLGCSLIDR